LMPRCTRAERMIRMQDQRIKLTKVKINEKGHGQEAGA
jgi:hypothetical protein